MEFEGKTEKEAIDKAVEALGLERDEFDVEILENNRPGLFHKGNVKIRVHINAQEDEANLTVLSSLVAGSLCGSIVTQAELCLHLVVLHQRQDAQDGIDNTRTAQE